MSFDWGDYLRFAEDLAMQSAGLPNYEAKLRTVISRAYYAVFCKARNHFRDKQRVFIPLTGEAHRIVWVHFKRQSNKSHKKIGENLRRLLNDRRCADYDDVIINLPILTNKAILRAQAIAAAMDKI